MDGARQNSAVRRADRYSVRCAIKQSIMIHKISVLYNYSVFRVMRQLQLYNYLFRCHLSVNSIIILWMLFYLVLICKRGVVLSWNCLLLPQIHWCLVCYCDLTERSKLSLRFFFKTQLLHRSIFEAATLDIETRPVFRKMHLPHSLRCYSM